MNFRVNYKGSFTYLNELKEELKKKIDLRKISIILNKNLFNFGLIIQSEKFSLQQLIKLIHILYFTM